MSPRRRLGRLGARLVGLAALGLLAACGGGGGGSTKTVFADAAIQFPTRFVRSGTTAERIHVRGTAVTTSSRIVGVRVNGVAATSSDGFAHWTANVPLVMGLNTLRADIAVVEGSIADVDHVEIVRASQVTDLVVGLGPAFGGKLRDPIWDEDGYYGFVLVENRNGNAADALVLVTLSSGDRVVWYDPTGSPSWGIGPSVLSGRSLNWLDSEHFLVADASRDAVLRIDVLADEGKDVSSSCVGCAMDETVCAVPLAAPNDLLVVDEDLAYLVWVDLAAQTRTIASGGGVGAGPAFVQPTAAVATDVGTTAYVADFDGNGRVLVVDLATGDRVLLTGGGAGYGPALGTIRDLHLQEARGRVLLTDDLGQVASVSLVDGRREILSDDTSWGPPTTARGMTPVGGDGTQALLADDEGLQLVDLVSGDRVVVSR